MSVIEPIFTASKQPDLAELEERIISQLNDCIWPRDRIPITDYPTELLDAIQSSEFVGIEGEYYTIKKERKSFFCRILTVTDRHPDLTGLVVLLVVCGGLYGFVVYQKAKARSLLPSILRTIENSENRMCFVGEVRRRLEEKGVSTFWTWRFIVPIVNQAEGVRRVEVKYSKPFWSLPRDDYSNGPKSGQG
jgi:hypothetical protein